MDLHQLNINDNDLKGPEMVNPMLSLNTDISSDQDDAAQEVAQWKQKNLHPIPIQNINSELSTGVLAPQSSDEGDEDEHKGGLPIQKATNLVSTYSSETNQSSEYIDDTETDVVSELPTDTDIRPRARHSSLLRRSSLHKWKTHEVNTEVHDMQRQLQHMQDEEQNALMEEMNKLKDKAKKSTQQQWIDQ